MALAAVNALVGVAVCKASRAASVGVQPSHVEGGRCRPPSIDLMSRAEELQESSAAAANVFYLPDGDEQRQRDARFATILEKFPFGTRQPIWEYDLRDALVNTG